MTRPSSLRIGHFTFAVRWDTADLNEQSREQHRDLAGYSSCVEQVIGIRPGHGADYERETLLHEVLHQCLRACNVDPDKQAKVDPDNVEEFTVAAIAGPLLAALRDNPKLTAYLTAKSSAK